MDLAGFYTPGGGQGKVFEENPHIQYSTGQFSMNRPGRGESLGARRQGALATTPLCQKPFAGSVSFALAASGTVAFLITRTKGGTFAATAD